MISGFSALRESSVEMERERKRERESIRNFFTFLSEEDDRLRGRIPHGGEPRKIYCGCGCGCASSISILFCILFC